MKNVLGLLLLSLASFAQEWQAFPTTGNSTPRHENSAVAIEHNFYLLGGRGIKAVEELNTKTGAWRKLADMPLEMHHFQAVSFQGEIYVLGALTGSYPHETPIKHVWIFNPQLNKWRKGPEIPRKRGGAGCLVHNNKIYLLCGIVDGHYNGHVTWFDAWNPISGGWEILPDAPHARDHVSIATVGKQLVSAGGRRSRAKTNEVMSLTESNVDIFNFETNKWTVAPQEGHIPTLRAGASAVVLDNKVLILGGESTSQVPAHKEVEAFDVQTLTWSTYPSLLDGRHGTGAAVINHQIFIAAGSKNRGGGPELNSVEVFKR